MTDKEWRDYIEHKDHGETMAMLGLLAIAALAGIVSGLIWIVRLVIGWFH